MTRNLPAFITDSVQMPMPTPTSMQTQDSILVITWGQQRHRRLFNMRLSADRDGLIRLLSWLAAHNEPFIGRSLDDDPRPLPKK